MNNLWYFKKDENIEEVYDGLRVFLSTSSIRDVLVDIIEYVNDADVPITIHCAEAITKDTSDTSDITGECRLMSEDGDEFTITFYKNRVGSPLYLFDPKDINRTPDTVIGQRDD